MADTASFEGRFSLSAAGMVTSLGLDAPTACAAARAGLNRAAQIEHFKLKTADGDIVGITGHAAPMVTHGFEGYARLLRLAQAGLTDLVRDLEGKIPSRASFYVSIPHAHRRFGGAALLVEDALRADYAQQLAETGGESAAPADIARVLLTQASGLAGWNQPFELRHVDTSGHTGVARALRIAVADLSSGRVDVAVVGGVDSLHGERTLQWLNDTGRLKTPAVAAGLQPGEAAAFVVLRRMPGSEDGRCLAVVEGLHFSEESQPLLSGQPPLGDGMAQALFANAVSARWDAQHAPWFISDHNGEPYRAYDWGQACTRLRRGYPQLAQGPIWHTAEAFGDTGCASGAVSLITVITALQRGYAPASSALILSASDGAGRAALRVGSAH